jgi:hypothetical protein
MFKRQKLLLRFTFMCSVYNYIVIIGHQKQKITSFKEVN